MLVTRGVNTGDARSSDARVVLIDCSDASLGLRCQIRTTPHILRLSVLAATELGLKVKW
jgi:hypothetical protein